MTPEQDIERAVRVVCENSGHWPYTADADVFIGWKPETDSFDRASGRRMRVAVKVDLVICHRRGADLEAERTRFALYRSLSDCGWKLIDNGPEVFENRTQMFYWPVTAVKGYGLDQHAQPYELNALN